MQTTENRNENVSLEMLIDQEWAKEIAVLDAAQAEKDNRIAEQRAQAMTTLRENLVSELGQALYDQLGIVVNIVGDNDAVAIFEDEESGGAWSIHHYRSNPLANYKWQFHPNRKSAKMCDMGELLHHLMIAIHRERMAKATADEMQRVNAEQDRQRQQQAETALAEARAEHNIIAAEIQKKMTSFREVRSFTVYPFTLYRLTYAAASAGGERTVFKHFWSDSDQVTPEGYVSGYKGEKSVCLKLINEIHFPVWEKIEVKSIDDLPYELTERVSFSVEGITFNWGFEERLYTRIEGDPLGGDNNSFYLSEGDVVRPVKWVRNAAYAQI